MRSFYLGLDYTRLSRLDHYAALDSIEPPNSDRGSGSARLACGGGIPPASCDVPAAAGGPSVSVTMWRMRPSIFLPTPLLPTPLLPTSFLPTSRPRGPPHSFVVTGWPMITPALGLASRPAHHERIVARRRRPRAIGIKTSTTDHPWPVWSLAWRSPSRRCRHRDGFGPCRRDLHRASQADGATSFRRHPTLSRRALRAGTPDAPAASSRRPAWPTPSGCRC